MTFFYGDVVHYWLELLLCLLSTAKEKEKNKTCWSMLVLTFISGLAGVGSGVGDAWEMLCQIRNSSSFVSGSSSNSWNDLDRHYIAIAWKKQINKQTV